MKLILNVYSDNETYNAACDYAFLDLDARTAGMILERIRLVEETVAKEEELWSIAFSGGLPDFFSVPEDEKLVQWLPGFNDDFRIVDDPAIYLPEALVLAVESEKMVVYNFSTSRQQCVEVAWTVTPRHCDFHVHTCQLPKDLIEQAAGV